jgi:hypothetical protein
MAKLTVIRGESPADSLKPNLGKIGLSLWNRVQEEYGITDVGGLETLYQLCAAADRAQQLSAQIDQDGPVIRTIPPCGANSLLGASWSGRWASSASRSSPPSPSVGLPASSAGTEKAMPTKRTPIKHTHRPRILVTDEALDIYAQMKAIACTCEPPSPTMPYYDVPEECSGCVEWAVLNRRLARLVELPLHEIHVTPPPSGECFLREEEESRRAAFEHALAEREDEPS